MKSLVSQLIKITYIYLHYTAVYKYLFLSVYACMSKYVYVCGICICHVCICTCVFVCGMCVCSVCVCMCVRVNQG